MFKHRTAFIWSLLFLLFFSLGFVTKVSDNYFEVSKSLDIFGKLFREVNSLYVEQTDPEALVRTGIQAMLSSLDPYTSYISEEEVEDYRVMSTGQYGGIGAKVRCQQDAIIIDELYEDYPAAKAGLLPGDQILAIDEQPIDGQLTSIRDVRSLLRGERGSTLKLEIQRAGRQKALRFELKRDRIWIKNVSYAGMVNAQVGYIALEGFSRRAGQEVAAALTRLKQQHPDLKGVILDLRGNPGGRLDEAIKVANVFLPYDELIVETRGRDARSRKAYHALQDPVDLELPLAVLVDGKSASASEIVAGAIQDLDRGVIVGQRSFGKGLVQKLRPLTHNTQLKVTSAKYYTPSGRCIQALDYAHKDAEGHPARITKDERHAFQTRNGRTVYDGGGIRPDHPVEARPSIPLVNQLVEEGLIFDYATQFSLEYKKIAPPREFEVSQRVFLDFLEFLQERDFQPHTVSDELLAQLETAFEQEGMMPMAKSQLEILQAQLQAHQARGLFTHQREIRRQIKREILRRYYYEEGPILAGFDHDPEISEAVSLLQASMNYHRLLQVREP